MARAGAGIYHPDNLYPFFRYVAGFRPPEAEDAVAELMGGRNVVIAIPYGPGVSISPCKDGMFDIKEIKENA